MSNLREQLLVVATSYAANRGRSLLRFLGDGNDGAVWESDQQTAIKALERRDSYLRERDAYLRLQDLGIVDIQGFAVLCLIDFDDTKQIVEMTVVFPPCILDFAKAYVDYPPDFSEDVLRDWQEVTAELLIADLAQVESLLDELRCLGIFYFDVKPGNIRFLP
jgi:ABC-type transporter Mla MlaB component